MEGDKGYVSLTRHQPHSQKLQRSMAGVGSHNVLEKNSFCPLEEIWLHTPGLQSLQCGVRFNVCFNDVTQQVKINSLVSREIAKKKQKETR